MTQLTDSDLFELAAPLRQVEAVTRPAGVPRRSERIPEIVRLAGIAVGIFLLVAVALLIAQHHPQGKPANPPTATSRPPRCTARADLLTGVIRDGLLVECGPASAVIRSGGWTHVFPKGNCERGGLNGGQWMYFGVRTIRHVPHLAIVLYTPVVWHASRPYAIKGDIEMLPGVSERVLGTAVSRSDVGKGTFVVRGVRSGRTYTGSWNCGAGQ
jgi:hypothetical protein